MTQNKTIKPTEGKGIKERRLFITKGGLTIKIFNKWAITLFSRIMTIEEFREFIK